MKRREFLGYSSAFLGATLAFGTQILAADSKDFSQTHKEQICNM